MSGTDKRAIVYAASAAAMWGTIGLFVHVLSAFGISSLDLTVSRFVVSVVLLGGYFLLFDRGKLVVKKSDAAWFLIVGIGCLLMFNVSYAIAIKQMSMSVAAVLLYTSPVFVTLISVPVFKEKLTRAKMIAILLSLTGCICVSGILYGVPAFPATAFVWGFAAALGYAMYSILASVLLRRYHPLTVLFYVFAAAAAGGLCIADPGAVWAVVTLHPRAGLIIIISALVCNIFSYLLYNMALKYMAASCVSIITSIEPPAASLLGVLFLGESVDWLGLTGIACILGAIVVLNKPERKKDETKTFFAD